MKANLQRFREQSREDPRGRIVEPGQRRKVRGCLIDTSPFMTEDDLNKAYRIFVEETKNDEMVCARGDLIVVTFDDEGRNV